jgi:hypothetical protein
MIRAVVGVLGLVPDQLVLDTKSLVSLCFQWFPRWVFLSVGRHSIRTC